MDRAVDDPRMAPVQPDSAPVRILLVDDTPQNLLALEAMLGDRGRDPAAGGSQGKLHPFAAGCSQRKLHPFAAGGSHDLLLVRAQSGEEALRQALQDDFAVVL